MFRQFLIVSVLLVGLALANDVLSKPEQEAEETNRPESPLNKLHSSLFYAQAEGQEVDETLEELRSAKNLIESEGDHQGLFTEMPYNPNLLISLYSTEPTCNPERAHEISQVIDYHQGKHGISNVVEFLSYARRYQLASCQVDEIQSKLAKAVANLDPITRLELPSVEKFVMGLHLDVQDKIRASDRLPTGELAELVLAYLKKSGKAPRFVARVINDNHIKSIISSTITLLEKINIAFQANLGYLSEVSKDSFVWLKLGAGEQSKILVGRFCQLVANAESLRQQVDERM